MFTGLFAKIAGWFLSAAILLTSFLGGGQAITPEDIPAMDAGCDVRVVQFNLRSSGVGKTSVAYRAPRLTAQLEEIGADSMGFQEASIDWMLYLSEHLEGYDFVGVGRTNGKLLGEFSPIFYKKDKYKVVDSGTFWLSKTPDKPGSKDWGSMNIRICTWALFENLETGARYAHLNTHLDHISDTARQNQMKLVMEKAEEFIGTYPVVLTGDMNDDNSSAMYSYATGVMKDSRLCAPVTDDKDTFHNYGSVTVKGLIDYVFVSEDIEPEVYHVIDSKINGDYLSDHYGIYVDMKF